MEPYPIACFGCHIDRKSSMHDLTYVKRQTRKRMKQLEIHRWVRSIFCIALFLSWIPFLQAQEKRLIDLELNEVPLSTALRQLEREGGKNILFVNDEVEAYRVTVRIQKQPLAEAIQLVLKDKPFICLERQDYFVVQRMDKNKKVEYIRGKVVNEQGKPIPYANVLVLQAGDSTFVNGCVTEDDGTFLLPDPYADHYLLRVTYVGYQSQTVTCMAENYLQMRPQENQLKEVTVTATRPLVERKNGAYLTHITGTPLSLMGSAADMIGHRPANIRTPLSVPPICIGTAYWLTNWNWIPVIPEREDWNMRSILIIPGLSGYGISTSMPISTKGKTETNRLSSTMARQTPLRPTGSRIVWLPPS